MSERGLDEVDLGLLADFADGTPALRKVDGQRFVCVRRGDDVHAFDDKCPHQGYPLSQGTVAGCVLTCQWHNWKFDLATGKSLFGGEPVRRYPTRVKDGRVTLNRAVDLNVETARFEAGLRAALVDADAARALREGLRLGQVRRSTSDSENILGSLGAAFRVVAQDAAARAAHGFDHGLATLTDILTWVERGWLQPEPAFVLAATIVAEPSRHLAARRVPGNLESSSESPSVVDALRSEQRDEAESRVRKLAESKHPASIVRESLLPFVAEGLFDYGHGTIFLAKAEELSLRFPDVAKEILSAITVTLGWASNETSLPPFSRTRKAVAEVHTLAIQGESTLERREEHAYEDALLTGENEALAATLALLGRGVSARALLVVAARAAAMRTARFDEAWEARVEAGVTVLDVTHTLTFVDACLFFADGSRELFERKMALTAAGFIGKLRRADVSSPTLITAHRGGLHALMRAVFSRDATRAREHAAGLSNEERLEAYTHLAPFFAFDMSVRPIRIAHGIKMAEALYRRHLADPEHGVAFLDALLAFSVPRRDENRFRHMAHIASSFFANGRPPEGLY
jgi:nitrite reductase/ring-hydroxylating ferredoxin subunit